MPSESQGKIRVLQLSVGSLLGQVLFDLLAERRGTAEVIGLNSEPDSLWNFLCDRVYLSPPLEQEDAFQAFFAKILKRHAPQVILPGRDDDVVFLARWRDAHPEWASQIPCGNPELASLLRDKWKATQWAQQHALPCALTCVYRGPQDLASLRAFREQLPLPWIAKPCQGDGSRGVFVIDSDEALEGFLKAHAQREHTEPRTSFVFQEYLSPPPELQQKLALLKWGSPLFFQIPEQRQYAAQSIIGPEGQLGEIFCSVSHMLMGRCEYLERGEYPELRDLMQRYCQVLAQEGWRGFVNLQAKPDRAGQWKMHELNLRLSGGSSARLLQGYDEWAQLFAYFYPELPQQDLASTDIRGPVQRKFQNWVLDRGRIDSLERRGEWP